ncbi:hypothetical protein RR46_13235 [Papilio xuthus]|uniref:Uncharacterized protein n=1 Tax=Papilio xuthus TaxID=66420 RepID=A0A194PSH2_PAPXU|nr:hypothetical protein RR46_13235 [Papilio xuthus]
MSLGERKIRADSIDLTFKPGSLVVEPRWLRWLSEALGSWPQRPVCLAKRGSAAAALDSVYRRSGCQLAGVRAPASPRMRP